MTRVAKKNIHLSDGTVIPKGVRVYIPALHVHSEDYYTNATEFQPRRFLELREQPGGANKYHFVTTSVEHPSFGHGKHACPGRFFASNEIKLILAHLIIRYDWGFINNTPPAHLPGVGGASRLDDDAEIVYRSREPELTF